MALVLSAIEGGYRLGSYRHRQSGREKEAPVGAMVGATLGLLAFMLAFTFGMAASRFDTRKQLVLDEANAIGTTYLRTAMLTERRDEIRALLRSYVDVRLEAVRSGRVVEQILKSEDIQGQLWSAATAVGLQNPDSIVVGLFVQSLNEVIDLHAKRVTAGLRNRIPGAIWVVLLTIAVLSLAAMGYHAGLVGTTRSIAIIVVAVTFSAVIALIANLHCPQEGSLIVKPAGPHRYTAVDESCQEVAASLARLRNSLFPVQLRLCFQDISLREIFEGLPALIPAFCTCRRGSALPRQRVPAPTFL